jgi:toxin ParE1/3/4
MAKFILDPCVEDELWAIWKFIAKDNSDAATSVIEAVHETFQLLAANPGLGRLREFRSSRLRGVRSFRVSGFDNYLIFYRVAAGTLQVLHVYHGARNLESLFGKN